MQVVSESELDDQDRIDDQFHDSNGIAVAEMDPPGDAEPAVDESEPEPALPPEEEEAESDDIAAEEMPTPTTEPTPAPLPIPLPPAASTIHTSTMWESHVNTIREQERSIAFAENEWNAAKEEAKIKKAAFDLAVSELREVIRRGPEQPSLFDPAPTSVMSGNTFSESTQPPEPPANVTPATDWRTDHIDSLPLTKTVARRLAKLAKEKGFTTVGQLDEWWDANGAGDEVLGFMLVDHARQIDEALRTVKESPPPSKADSVADDDSWKSVPVVELEILGLAKGIIQKLLDAGISTLGELADYPNERRDLTSIKGIGSAAQDRISDATIRFHAERAKG